MTAVNSLYLSLLIINSVICFQDDHQLHKCTVETHINIDFGLLSLSRYGTNVKLFEILTSFQTNGFQHLFLVQNNRTIRLEKAAGVCFCFCCLDEIAVNG